MISRERSSSVSNVHSRGPHYNLTSSVVSANLYGRCVAYPNGRRLVCPSGERRFHVRDRYESVSRWRLDDPLIIAVRGFGNPWRRPWLWRGAAPRPHPLPFPLSTSRNEKWKMTLREQTSLLMPQWFQDGFSHLRQTRITYFASGEANYDLQFCSLNFLRRHAADVSLSGCWRFMRLRQSLRQSVRQSEAKHKTRQMYNTSLLDEYRGTKEVRGTPAQNCQRLAALLRERRLLADHSTAGNVHKMSTVFPRYSDVHVHVRHAQGDTPV